MKIDRKGLKAQAKQAIRAAAPVFWLVTLVYLLLTEGLSTVVGWLAPTFQPADLLWGGTVGWLSLFISILLTLYLWVMDFGYRLWALRVTRSGVWDAAGGFRHRRAGHCHEPADPAVHLPVVPASDLCDHHPGFFCP